MMNEESSEQNGWREALKDITKKLENYPNNLQNIHTPFVLCNDIIGKLKDSIVFEDKTFCTINLEFVETLMYDCGVKGDRIWFVTDCKEKAAIAKHERYKGVNVVVCDFLKWEPNMKFDVMIGNPPYQAPKERTNKDSKDGACGKSLWKNFVSKSLSLVKDGGYVALIHPSLWRKPENSLFPEFKARDLRYVEMHSLDDGIKTFGASTAYDWYILKNSKYAGKTIIKDVDGKTESVDISNFECIPSSSFDLFEKLLAKNEEEKCEVIYARSNYGSDKPNMSATKQGEFKYPCMYMNTKDKGIQLWYSSTNQNGHFGVKKVIISENGFLGVYNDFKGEYGLTQFMFAISIKSKEEGEQISTALKSDKFKKIWQATQWMSNHREWRVFKYFRKEWYKEFTK